MLLDAIKIALKFLPHTLDIGVLSKFTPYFKVNIVYETLLMYLRQVTGFDMPVTFTYMK